MEVTNTTNMGASFGELLRQKREKLGLSIEQVSTDIFVLKRHIEALEAEDFKNLPQAAFARGFLVNYAKYLELDSVSLLQAFDTAYPEELKIGNTQQHSSPIKPLGTLHRESRTKVRVNPLLIMTVLALLGLAVFVYLQWQTPTVSSEVAQTNEVVEPMANSADENMLNTNEQIAGAALVTPAGLGNSNQQLSTVATPNTPLTAIAADAKPVELVFWVRKNTQIHIVDATGKVVMDGVKPRSEQRATGIPPLQISIDELKNVSLNVNKVPVKFKKYTQQTSGPIVFTFVAGE